MRHDDSRPETLPAPSPSGPAAAARVLEDLPCVVAVLDADDRVSYVNSRVADFYDVDPDALIGQRPADLLAGGALDHFADAAGAEAWFRGVVAAPEQPHERVFHLRDGRRVLYRSTPGGREGGRIALHADVTHLEQAPAEAGGAEPDLRGELDRLAAALARVQQVLGDGSEPVRPGPVGQRPLTPREREVLRRLSFGQRNDDVARELELSPDTVRTYVHRAMEKLEVRTRTQAVAEALRRGFII